MLAASTCIVIGISSYPCSLLIQSAARRDHQVTVRLRHSPGIYPTIQWEEKKCKLSLPPNTRAASIRPQSETFRIRKGIKHVEGRRVPANCLVALLQPKKLPAAFDSQSSSPRLLPPLCKPARIRRNHPLNSPPSNEKDSRTEHGIPHSQEQ